MAYVIIAIISFVVGVYITRKDYGKLLAELNTIKIAVAAHVMKFENTAATDLKEEIAKLKKLL